jgi:hypothetical protein
MAREKSPAKGHGKGLTRVEKQGKIIPSYSGSGIFIIMRKWGLVSTFIAHSFYGGGAVIREPRKT